jgi:hypothetical protein
MTRGSKTWMFLFLGMAVVAMILLSASLSELEFLPGQPFSLGRRPAQVGLGGAVGEGDVLVALLRALVILTAVLTPFAIIYLIVSPKARKRLLTQLVPIFLLLFFFYRWTSVKRDLPGEESQPVSGLPPITLPPSSLESVPDPPQWLTLVTSLGLAVLIAAFLVGALWLVWRGRRRPASSLKQLAQEAQEALDALLAGADLRNTIMRCYFEMARVLSEQRGIRRQKDMTPREFERRLEKAGLPGEPVQRLTRLFEQVRYGTKVPNEREEGQAIACLTAIIEACRSLP